ncbi:MAG: alpha-L-rhamnosidase [Bacteroidales bacterium]|nr:alpha-L-rhamnosidase [Bacteroidales bacterium]
MKKYLLSLLIMISLTGADVPLSDSPSGLMVEFIREPGNVKILDLKPEFTWIVPQKAKVQTSFQILVASTKEILEKNSGDIWNSQRVMSSLSSEVEYRGNSLSANTSYYWKVRIWNSRKKPTKYSEIQTFTTGNPAGYSTTGNRFQTSLIEPEKLIKTGDGHYFADFGKDAFGTLILELNPVKQDTLIVHIGEKIKRMNQIDRNPGGSIRYHEVLMPVEPGKTQYTLNLPPDSRNTGLAAVHLPDTFGVITPFRYCELENCSSEPRPNNLHQKTFNYFFSDKMSSFASSDTILNKIWEICKYSMKATSFTGIYIDGDRERIPYEADAYINQMGHYYTDREYSLARRTNEYFIKHPTWPTEWILHTIPMFYYDFLYTGNIESVGNYYEELKYKTLLSLARKDGLISSKNCSDDVMKDLGFSNTKERLKDIVDWPSAQKNTTWKLATVNGERDGYEMVDINTVVNAFYYHSLDLMSVLAGRLGKTDDSVFFQNEALKVKKVFNEIFLDRATGIYKDGESSQHSSLHANMMALAFDLVPDKNKKSVIDFIKTRGMACSVYGAQYLLEGLYRAGESDYALSLLTATGDRSWWNMIRTGSTITMEAWDMKYKPNSDWNHAWGAVPANIIPRCMWGIVPVKPGFAKAIIKPQLSSLKYSKVSVPTIRGNIEAEFKTTENSKEYFIVIPANMECDFILLNSQPCSVFLNGYKVTLEKDKLKLKPGLNKIIMESAS